MDSKKMPKEIVSEMNIDFLRSCENLGLHYFCVPTGGGKSYSMVQYVCTRGFKKYDRCIIMIPQTKLTAQMRADFGSVIAAHKKIGDCLAEDDIVVIENNQEVMRAAFEGAKGQRPIDRLFGEMEKYSKSTSAHTNKTRSVKKPSKGKGGSVIRHIIDGYDNMTARLTSITGHEIPNDDTAFRIIVSLYLNMLGKEGNAFMMDGALFILDTVNFRKKSDKELLALKIEVRDGRTLWAGTVTFRNPFKDEIKDGKSLRVYESAGRLSKGSVPFRSLKLARVDTPEDLSAKNLRFLWVRKTRRAKKDADASKDGKTKSDGEDTEKAGKNEYKGKRNTVPYLPFDPDEYKLGKLSILDSVLDSLNGTFGLDLRFSEYPVAYYDECKPGDDTLRFLKEYMRGRRIYIDDGVKSLSSESLIKEFKDAVVDLGFAGIEYPSDPKGDDMILRTCATLKKGDKEDATYRKGRDTYRENALQHLALDDAGPDHDMKNIARRILMELFIKDCVARRRMPPLLASCIQGWTFTRYKVTRRYGDNFVRGASLRASTDGTVTFEDIDPDELSPGILLDRFLSERLHVDTHKGTVPSFLYDSKNVLVMSKGTNIYILKDRDEIPLLDLDSVQAAFDRFKSDPETYKFSHMKNKDYFQDFFRGYFGLHLFVSENGNFCYFAGIDHTSPTIMKGFKIDKMPHAREIVPLQQEAGNRLKPEEGDLHEILGMLKLGFGRWNELMTYPFPFKFLYEYLDKWCLDKIGRHWDEIEKLRAR